MTVAGFCRVCGQYVWLNDQWGCVNGHAWNEISNWYDPQSGTPVTPYWLQPRAAGAPRLLRRWHPRRHRRTVRQLLRPHPRLLPAPMAAPAPAPAPVAPTPATSACPADPAPAPEPAHADPPAPQPDAPCRRARSGTRPRACSRARPARRPGPTRPPRACSPTCSRPSRQYPGYTVAYGTDTDVVIDNQVADANWGTGKKKVEYSAIMKAVEPELTVYFWEILKEKGAGLSFGGFEAESYSTFGTKRSGKTKEVVIGPDGQGDGLLVGLRRHAQDRRGRRARATAGR